MLTFDYVYKAIIFSENIICVRQNGNATKGHFISQFILAPS